MIKILFVRNETAYLPEIGAYIKYFNNVPGFEAFDSGKISSDYDLSEFDVVWEFKGIGGLKSDDHFIVHEYTSLSTGKFPKTKDIIKSIFNPKPNLRVFLNETVERKLNFRDNINFCLRDMGIDEIFLNTRTPKKEYDFVYIGSITKGREIDKFLNRFTRKNNGKLCLIGEPSSEIYNEYKSNKDIIFTGKVPYEEVPNIASKAEFGINYIPDKYPLNLQTSTKILEYLALDLKIITTDYRWISNFEKKYNCSFYKLSDDSFNVDDLRNFEFKSEFKPEDHLWDIIIGNSKIKDKIIEGIAKG